MLGHREKHAEIYSMSVFRAIFPLLVSENEHEISYSMII